LGESIKGTIMDKNAESSQPRLTEMVARTLRHEVGDLLQTVYSAIAILRTRLPADAESERRLLSELHTQAETCKFKLDAVQDLTCPLKLNCGPTNLGEVAAGLAVRMVPRFPNIELRVEGPRTLMVVADGQRLSQIGYLLLLSALQAAHRQVRVNLQPQGDDKVEWSITDDGPGANAEQLSWFAEPFTTTHFAQFGLGVAVARRVIELHGGTMTAGNLPGGGFHVVLTLPAAPP
jgi:signal transduction histidine kinase